MTHWKISLAAAAVLALGAVSASNACTRFTYVGANNAVYTGRTMDWSVTDNVSLHLMPRGIERKSYVKEGRPAKWTSKYGSVIAVSFEESLNSGINEAGLAVDGLWLEVSDYGSPKKARNTVGGNEFPLYVMDNFATVAEVVSFIEKGKLGIVQEKVPGTDTDLKLHFMVTDKTGDNAVIEFIKGQPVVYRMKGIAAMTNDPVYPEMKSIEQLYRDRGLEKNMPGTSHAVDRYLRAVGWMNQVKHDEAIAPEKVSDYYKVMGILRAVSTPLGLSDAENPQNCSTLWRVATNLNEGTFTIDSAYAMTTFTVKLSDLDFSGKKEKVIHIGDIDRTASQNLAELFR